MTIKQLQKLCHKIAVEKGFWEYICLDCKGKGKIKVIVDINAGQITNTLFSYKPKFKKCYDICWNCNGTGKIKSDRNNAEMIALMHSELSEALEDLRRGRDNHVGSELADCMIRVMDFCEARGIDLEKEILKKIKKNKKRKYKHGKKF